MFAVIYRGYIKPGSEEQYQKCWKRVATYFVTERGALGSTLHRTEEGMWLAYSRWPDKATRNAAWPREGEKINTDIPADMRESIECLKACLDKERQLPEICMEIAEEVTLNK